jgi:Transposase DDE domain
VWRGHQLAYEAFNRRHFESFVITFHPEAEFRNPRDLVELGIGEPDNGPHLSAIRQRIESVFKSFKDILTLERHRRRTLPNFRARIAQRILALTACVDINHWLGRPSRSLVAYVA